MNIDVDAVLESLKDGKTNKTKSSLEKLNQTLKAYYESGAKDFSITTIGRVSEEGGGVGYQSIRATANKHYRELVEVWAAKAQTTTKKPRVGPAKKTSRDYQLLERIEDTAVRALFGQIVRERDRYKREANMLKSQTQVIIDRRPAVFMDSQTEARVEVLASLREVCSDNEINALRSICTEEWLEELGFQENALGQVKDEYGLEVLPRGFLTGLRKILGKAND